MVSHASRITYLALVVIVQTNVVKVFNDFLGCRVLLDLAVRIKHDHVARAQLANALERLLETVLLDRVFTRSGQGDDEVHSRVGVVLFVVLQRVASSRWVSLFRPDLGPTTSTTHLDQSRRLLRSNDPGLKLFLVALCPHSDR